MLHRKERIKKPGSVYVVSLKTASCLTDGLICLYVNYSVEQRGLNRDYFITS